MPLNKDWLSIILDDANYEKLISSYPNDGSKLLNHIKSLLVPKDFFDLTSIEITVPTNIQQQLFSLLSMDEIHSILIKHSNPTDGNHGILKTLEQSVAINALCDLVVREYGKDVVKVLAQVTGLENLSIRLEGWHQSFRVLRENIRLRLDQEQQFRQCLGKHSFFTKNCLLEIINSKNMELQLREIIVGKMENKVPIEYQYFLKYNFTPIYTFLQSDNPGALLSKESGTWPTFLDSILQFVSGKGRLREFLKGVFGFELKYFDYNQRFGTWKKAFDEYVMTAKKELPGADSIVTLDQLYMVKNMGFELNETRVYGICKIIEFLPRDFDYRNSSPYGILFKGMKIAMANLLEKHSAFEPVLIVASEDGETTGYFLDSLSGNNYCYDNLNVVDSFLKYWKKHDKLEGFIQRLAYRMKSTVKGDLHNIEEINTAMDLFNWINNQK